MLGITSHPGLLHCVEHNSAVTKKHPRDWERRKITLSNLEGSCLGICFGKEKVDLLIVLSSGVQSYPGNALDVLLPSAVGRVQADFIHNNEL